MSNGRFRFSLNNQNFIVKLLAHCSHDVAVLTLQFCKTYCSNVFDFYSLFCSSAAARFE